MHVYFYLAASPTLVFLPRQRLSSSHPSVRHLSHSSIIILGSSSPPPPFEKYINKLKNRQAKTKQLHRSNNMCRDGGSGLCLPLLSRVRLSHGENRWINNWVNLLHTPSDRHSHTEVICSDGCIHHPTEPGLSALLSRGWGREQREQQHRHQQLCDWLSAIMSNNVDRGQKKWPKKLWFAT